jgi:hypothetical protein
MDKAIEQGLRVVASDMAAADPLPGSIATVFEPESIEIAGVKLRKMFPIDEAIWKLIDSPINKMILEAAKPKDIQEPVESTTEDELGLIHQFTLPIRDAYKLARSGKEVFLAAAVEKSMDYSVLQTKELLGGVMKQISTGYGTKINHVPDAAPEDGAVPLTPASAVQ